MNRIILATACTLLVVTPSPTGDVARAERGLLPQTADAHVIQQSDSQQTPVPTDELQCLADAIYFEARGESKANRVAVGQVVIHRLRARQWPDTICGVVHQGTGGDVCQFSWACDKARRVDEPDAHDDALRLAELLYVEYKVNNTIPDIVSGATHFHNTTVQPGWAGRLEQTARIDEHIFYAQRS